MEKIFSQDSLVSTSSAAEVWGPWDARTQTFHAGQEWRTLENFVADFSVDVNALGTPASGIDAARKALAHMAHYPPCDFEPALSHLAKFLWPKDTEWIRNKSRLLLGNGCSEVIDLITRCAMKTKQDAGCMKPGPYPAQYNELRRAAVAAGFTVVSSEDKSANLLGLCNPNTPTGDYMTSQQLKEYIEGTCSENCTVIVDETNQPFLGPNWRDDSLISQTEWLHEMATKRKITVFVVHSWTKLYACAGVRLGSMIAPTVEAYELVKSRQVPWTVNNAGLCFLSAVLKDDEHLKKTWEIHKPLRQRAKNILERDFGWSVHGESWVPSLWVDTGDEKVASKVVKLGRTHGVPVRPGALGYDQPTYFRMSVRSEELQDLFFQAIASLAKDKGLRR